MNDDACTGDFCPKCTPTKMQPVVTLSGEEPEQVKPGDVLKVTHVRPRGTVEMYLTGTKDGQEVRCKSVAEVKASILGRARIEVPANVEGKVNIACNECGIVSNPIGVG